MVILFMLIPLLLIGSFFYFSSTPANEDETAGGEDTLTGTDAGDSFYDGGNYDNSQNTTYYALNGEDILFGTSGTTMTGGAGNECGRFYAAIIHQLAGQNPYQFPVWWLV